MIIKDIEAYPIRMEMENFAHSADPNAPKPAMEQVIIKIIGEDGTYGTGEAMSRLFIYGETPASIIYALNSFVKPRFIGQDSLNVEKLRLSIGDNWSIANNHTLKAALDSALYDLNGKQLGVPAYVLLGGKVRDKVQLSVCMPGSRGLHDEQVRNFKKHLDDGIRAFKLKVGKGAQIDIDFVRELHDIAPEGTYFYMDANEQYSREDALRVLTALDGIIHCCEEPLPTNDNDGRRALASKVNVPILGDDSVFTTEAVWDQIQLGAIGRIGIKVARTGITQTMRIIHMAEAASLPVHMITQLASDICVRTGLQIAAASPWVDLPCEFIHYKCHFTDSLLKQELEIENGFMKIPEAPGLGSDPDWDKIEKYRMKVTV